jgi:signal transduction histidine kinase
VRAQLELVTESRARIVEAADEERRRIERNLHDGAQQRLVTLSLSLAMASELVDEQTDPELGRLLKGADEDARRAIAELRELARGIHPAILTNAGLRPALRSLANRSPVPVRLERVTARRLPAQVEGTAYYAVAEALTNVAKHAGASSATIRATASNGTLAVEITDDGVGGADPQGSGLRGLADRVTALAGTMSVESPSGAGTRIRVRIPCE